MNQMHACALRLARPRAATAGLLAGAALGLALLGGCGGGGGASVAEPTARNEAALAASQPGEVLAYVKSRLSARGPQYVGYDLRAIDAPMWLSVAATTSGTVERSGTTVQEQGVDEEDLIKSDGSTIFTLEPVTDYTGSKSTYANLAAYARTADGQLQNLSAIGLSAANATWVATSGMVLAPEVGRLAVIAQGSGDPVAFPTCPAGQACIALLPPSYMPSNTVHLKMLDVSSPARPNELQHWVIDGRLVGTRQVGRMLYVVAAHAPAFAYDLLPTTATEAERKAVLAQLTVADVLPKISVNGGAKQLLVNETDCWLQTANASTQVALTTITAIDLGSPTLARTSRCFVGGTEALYMSPASIYLATTRSAYQTIDTAIRFAPEMRTDIHKFAVDAASINYRGSGDVAGHLGWDREKAPYRMSEHNGDLRVLTFTGSRGWVTLNDAVGLAASPATLTILRERSSDRSLQAVASLPNAQRPAPIGHAGEQVYAVRFFGDRAYVVTFRQTDPLYVLDLSNPADPRAAGELAMPGFSDYLFPVGDGLLFGVGKDADDQGRIKGVKVALFDVRDASKPQQLATQSFGERGSYTALDFSRHGIDILQSGNTARIALPMLLQLPTSMLPQQGLQRFEVDVAARKFGTKPWLAVGAPNWADLSTARSLQIGSNLYYFAQGKLNTFAW